MTGRRAAMQPRAGSALGPGVLLRQTALAVLAAAMIVLPRAWIIQDAHSETVDEAYHLLRGMILWTRPDLPISLNDPPLGAMLTAVPLLWNGCDLEAPARDPFVCAHNGERWYSLLYGQERPPDRLLRDVALWKAGLALVLYAVGFAWGASLYGVAAGWLVLALLLVEPTLTAHAHLATVDVIGVAGLMGASLALWHYWRDPSQARLVVAALACAAALLIKHTTATLPLISLAFALAWWRRRRRLAPPGAPAADRLGLLARRYLTGAGLTAIFIWALTGWDISRPIDSGIPPYGERDAWEVALWERVRDAARREWPAGKYLGSVLEAVNHNKHGHENYLHDEVRWEGWWHYFPVVATYKAPIGIAAAAVLAGVSLARRRASFAELGLLIPATASLWLIMNASINIGFRHALIVVAPLLVWCGRAASAGRAIALSAWACVLVAAVDVARWSPDYLSYVNRPRQGLHLRISDSNIDWAQSFKQVARWIDARPDDGRPIWVAPWADATGLAAPYHIGRRAGILDGSAVMPRSGILIVSPVRLSGQYYARHQFEEIRRLDPHERIGHSQHVYDLDRLTREGLLSRTPPGSDRSGAASSPDPAPPASRRSAG